MKDEPIDICIWDNDSARIAEIDANLARALRSLGMRGNVRSMSEPPLLAREGLLNDVPALEIAGRYWKLRPNQTISEEACRSLLRRFHGE